MKRASLLIMTLVMGVALCFSSCKKEDTDNENATLSDFAGTYDVTITEKPLLGENVSYKATLTIEAATAELLGISIYESESVAKLTFTTTDDELAAKGYFPLLSSNKSYGYVKNGYLIMGCTDVTSLEYTSPKMAYKKAGSTATYTGLYNVTLPIEIAATRR